MNPDPELAKRSLKSTLLQLSKCSTSTTHMAGDFDPPAAREIHLNLDRYHGVDKATRQGLLLNF